MVLIPVSNIVGLYFRYNIFWLTTEDATTAKISQNYVGLKFHQQMIGGLGKDAVEAGIHYLKVVYNCPPPPLKPWSKYLFNAVETGNNKLSNKIVLSCSVVSLEPYEIKFGEQ